ncbi:transposase [Archangium violaceum]|uniref:transposase n=1 Tax=Archangium violaceum TaxID=83451 RepID=UPI003D28D7BC
MRGILFILRTDLPWEWLPQEVFGVSGVACWRRLREWAQAGVLEALQQTLPDELGEKGCLDWSRAAVDSFSVPAKKGGLLPARILRTGERRAPSTTWW